MSGEGKPPAASRSQSSTLNSTKFQTTAYCRADAGSAEAVEFIFPLSWLRAYEQYCTGQQLINQAFVLINGERVTLDVQGAEARVTCLAFHYQP